MLDTDKRDSIVLSGLYKRSIPSGEKTWCRNGTYVVKLYDNNLVMCDTYYFNDYKIKLTNDNFNDFQLVMDFYKVVPVDKSCFFEYNECDRFNFATDSGGHQYSKYYRLKDAKRSKELKVQLLIQEIKQCEYSLRSLTSQLKSIDNDDLYE